jgi:imidazolonepropionase-like amidohydrolase
MVRFRVMLLFMMLVAAVNATAATKAIKFGKLWDGSKVISNAVVVVENDKIVSVAPNGRVPAGAQVIDLSRFTGIPGMIDAHTHVTYYWDHAAGTTPRTRPAKPRHVAVTVVLSQENGMKSLEAGVTALRDLNAQGGADMALRDLINMGKLVGPRLFVSGVGLRSYKDQPGVTDPIAEVIKMTNTRIDEGADWIKVFASVGGFENVNMDQTVSYEEIKAIVDTAHGRKVRVACHSYGPDGARDIIRAGCDTLEHATDMDDATIAEMARKKIWYVPTIDHNQYYVENADNVYQFAPGSLAEHRGKEALLDYIKRNFATATKAFKAGARLLVGSDAVYNGFGLNMRELTWFVKMGMTNEQALKTATTDQAEMLGMEKSLGHVAPGYFADIVAVEGDPLADINVVIKNVRWVMKGGDVVVDKTKPARSH